MNKNIILYVLLCIVWVILGFLKLKAYSEDGQKIDLILGIVAILLLILNIYRIIQAKRN